MKLAPNRIDAYLANPGESRAALIFGEDAELVRERVRQLTVAVAGAVDDPFRVASMSREGLGSLAGELAARSLLGGRRVVVLSDMTDAACGPLERALAQSAEGFLVVEAGPLATKSKLRLLFEGARDAASIPCFPLVHGEAAALFAQRLMCDGIAVSVDALAWAEHRLGLDRSRVRAEADRVALYIHPDSLVSLEAAQICLDEGDQSALDDLVDAVFSGDTVKVDSSIESAFLGGATAVGVLMVVLSHLARIHRCAVLLRSGISEAEAMRSLRPPVFYRRQSAFAATLRHWSVERLSNAASVLGAAEFGCKQTGSPAELLVRNALLRLSRSAGPSHRVGSSAALGSAGHPS